MFCCDRCLVGFGCLFSFGLRRDYFCGLTKIGGVLVQLLVWADCIVYFIWLLVA